MGGKEEIPRSLDTYARNAPPADILTTHVYKYFKLAYSLAFVFYHLRVLFEQRL